MIVGVGLVVGGGLGVGVGVDAVSIYNVQGSSLPSTGHTDLCMTGDLSCSVLRSLSMNS